MPFVKHSAGKIKEQITVKKGKGGKKTVASKPIPEVPASKVASVSEPEVETKPVMKDAVDGNK